MTRFSTWARPIAGLVALALVLAGGAPMTSAAENQAAPTKGSLRASAVATVEGKPLPSGALAQTTPAASTADKGFFGTTAGRLALVLMAAGTGYMVYSAFKDNDPVKSVFR